MPGNLSVLLYKRAGCGWEGHCAGATCSTTADCAPGLSCKLGHCASQLPGTPCTAASDCSTGICLGSVCRKTNSASKLGDWTFCSRSDECENSCCSREYSHDNQFKCTPFGFQCRVDPPLQTRPVARSSPQPAAPVLRDNSQVDGQAPPDTNAPSSPSTNSFVTLSASASSSTVVFNTLSTSKPSAFPGSAPVSSNPTISEMPSSANRSTSDKGIPVFIIIPICLAAVILIALGAFCAWRMRFRRKLQNGKTTEFWKVDKSPQPDEALPRKLSTTMPRPILPLLPEGAEGQPSFMISPVLLDSPVNHSALEVASSPKHVFLPPESENPSYANAGASLPKLRQESLPEQTRLAAFVNRDTPTPPYMVNLRKLTEDLIQPIEPVREDEELVESLRTYHPININILSHTESLTSTWGPKNFFEHVFTAEEQKTLSYYPYE